MKRIPVSLHPRKWAVLSYFVCVLLVVSPACTTPASANAMIDGANGAVTCTTSHVQTATGPVQAQCNDRASGTGDAWTQFGSCKRKYASVTVDWKEICIGPTCSMRWSCGLVQFSNLVYCMWP